MRCLRCGKENAEQACLCAACGTALPAEEGRRREQKSRKALPLAAKLFLLLLLCLSVMGGTFAVFWMLPGNRCQRQLDLGHRQLLSLSYEEAVLSFRKAIAMDPKNPEPYLGLAEAYIGKAEALPLLEREEAGRLYAEAIEAYRQAGELGKPVRRRISSAEEARGSILANGWVSHKGEWYYFDESGRLLKEQWIEGYYVDKDGKRLRSTTAPSGTEPVIKKAALAAYADLLENYEPRDGGFDLGYPMFFTAYIDRDEIPELVVFEGAHHGAGGVVYCYYQGNVNRIGEYGEWGSISYWEKQNLILEHFDGSGMTKITDKLYEIREGKENVLQESYTLYDDYGTAQQYFVDGKEVSKAESEDAWNTVLRSYDGEAVYKDFTNAFSVDAERLGELRAGIES